MRETEIVRGLGKARTKHNAQIASRNNYAKGMVPGAHKYADGMVPYNSFPDIVAEATAEANRRAGIAPAAPAAVAAPALAVPQPNALQRGAENNSGLLGRAARALRGGTGRAEESYSRGTAYLHGPGTGTSDSIPANLSRGEAVLPAKTVQKVGAHNIARLIQDTNDGVAPKTGLRAGGNYQVGGVHYDGADEMRRLEEAAKKLKAAAVTPAAAPPVAPAAAPATAPVTPTPVVEPAQRNLAGKAIDAVKSGASKVAAAVKNVGNVTPGAATTSTASTIAPTAAPGPVNYDIAPGKRGFVSQLTPVEPGTPHVRQDFTKPAPAGTRGPSAVPQFAKTAEAIARETADDIKIKASNAPPGGPPGGPPPGGPPLTPPKPPGMIARGLSAAGKLFAPLALGATAVATGKTPTEQYRERFALGPSGEGVAGLAGDIGVRTLGAASDLGNVLTFGQAGRLFRDKQSPEAAVQGAPIPEVPVAPATVPGTNIRVTENNAPSQGLSAARAPAPARSYGKAEFDAGQPGMMKTMRNTNTPEWDAYRANSAAALQDWQGGGKGDGIRTVGPAPYEAPGGKVTYTGARQPTAEERAVQAAPQAAAAGGATMTMADIQRGAEQARAAAHAGAGNLSRGRVVEAGNAAYERFMTTAATMYGHDSSANATRRTLASGQAALDKEGRENAREDAKNAQAQANFSITAGLAQTADARAAEESAVKQLGAEVPMKILDGDKEVDNPAFARLVGDGRYTAGQFSVRAKEALAKAKKEGAAPEKIADAEEYVAAWYDPQTKQAKSWGQLDGPQRAELIQMSRNRARVEEATKRPGSKWLLGTFDAKSRDLAEYDFKHWEHGIGKDEGYVVSPTGDSRMRVSDLRSTEAGNYILTNAFKDNTAEFFSQLPKKPKKPE